MSIAPRSFRPSQGSYLTPAFERATVAEAVELMFEHGVAHLVVTDGDARPVGVLSTLDVAGVVAWGRA